VTPEEVFRVEGPPKNVASGAGTGTNGATPATPAGGSAPGTPTASAPPPASSDNGGFRFGMGPPGGGFGDRGGFGRDRGGFGDRGGSRGFQSTPEERITRNKRIIAGMDRNGDGKLQPDEISQYGFWRTLRERFNEYDTNKDGAIDAEEMTAFFDAQFRMGGR
jgi:hypothetical protein